MEKQRDPVGEHAPTDLAVSEGGRQAGSECDACII
jgi:hypothetical protein